MCFIIISMSLSNNYNTKSVQADLLNTTKKSTTRGCGSSSSASSSSDSISDLIQLDVVSSDRVAGLLGRRWGARDEVYTALGARILLYIRPNKGLDLYSEKVRAEYRRGVLSTTGIVGAVGGPPPHPSGIPPHLYSLLNTLVTRSALRLSLPTSTVLFSGLPGTGKSTHLKHALQYFLSAGENSTNTLLLLTHFNLVNAFVSAGGSTKGVLLVRVSLEVGGGGLVGGCGRVVGGGVGVYHLQRWRVSRPGGGPNFDVFGGLLAGAGVGLLKTLHLTRNPRNYKILHHHSPSSFATTPLPIDQIISHLSSLQQLQLQFQPNPPPPHPSNLLPLLSAILHLGNASFTPTTHLDGSTTTTVDPALDAILQDLLSTSEPPLSLISRESSEPTLVLETLMETLYVKILVWLCSLLSDGIGPSSSSSSSVKPSRSASSTLSLPGGGVFIASSSSEQQQERIHVNLLDLGGDPEEDLLTRYAQEKVLHALLDKEELRRREGEVLADGIEWIGGLEGVGRGEFLRGVEKGTAEQAPPTTHQPPLPLPLQTLLSHSHNPLLSHFFPPPPPPPHPTLKKHVSQPVPTPLTLLKSTLDSLLQSRLLPPNSTPYHVISLRPSPHPLLPLEPALLRHQLYLFRVIDLVKFEKAFSFSFNFPDFLRRYKLLSLRTWPRVVVSGPDRAACVAILEDLCFCLGGDYVLGKGRVWLKRGSVLSTLEGYRAERLEDLAVLIQKTWRGHRVKSKFLRMKRSIRLIVKFMRKYRKLRMKRDLVRRRAERGAVLRIQRFYIAWKRRCYLWELASTTSSRLLSPVCRDWPVVPSYLAEANGLLKGVFHRWRCARYRACLTPTQRLMLNEKSTASMLFRGNKESYERSLSHPFLGDYIRLRQNAQWIRSRDSTTGSLVFADLVNRVKRSNGGLTPTVLVLNTAGLLLLDPRTLTVKYRFKMGEIRGFSMSPFSDDFCVVHVGECEEEEEEEEGEEEGEELKAKSGCLCGSESSGGVMGGIGGGVSGGGGGFEVNGVKGDLILHTSHLVEFVTKAWLVAGMGMAAAAAAGGAGGGSGRGSSMSRRGRSCGGSGGGGGGGAIQVEFSEEIPCRFHGQAQVVTFNKTTSSSTFSSSNQTTITRGGGGGGFTSGESRGETCSLIIPPGAIRIRRVKRGLEFTF